MKIDRRWKVILLALVSLGFYGYSLAAFDQWAINEVFSNSDGDIQYIELLTASDIQQDLEGLELISKNNNGEEIGRFVVDSNLVGGTTNVSILFATQAFADITGLEPNFIIPENFISRNGGSLDFADGVSELSYLPGELPLNGQQSIGPTGVVQPSSPRNSSGLDSSVAVPINAAFNIDSNILTLPILNVPSVGIASVNFSVDLDLLQFTLLDDFFVYSPGIAATESAAEFREDNSIVVPRLPIGAEVFEFEMGLVQSDPLVFGNLEVISVTNTNVAVPDPEPEQNPLQESISRGQQFYNQQCSACHGVDGSGVSAPSLLSNSQPTFDALRSRIDFTMPIGNPSRCTDNAGDTCATDISNYVINVLR